VSAAESFLEVLLGLTFQNYYKSTGNIDTAKRLIMRRYHVLAFASAVVATLSAPNTTAWTNSSSTSSSVPTPTGQLYYHNTQAGGYAPLVVSASMTNSTISTTTPSQMMYRYLGCYTSTNSTALFTSPTTLNNIVTTESCVYQCAAGSYNISGVLAGNLCGCNAKLSNTVSPNGRVDERYCREFMNSKTVS